MSYLSNLPPGCTMEMLEAFHGEGKIEDSYECDTCLRENIDPYDCRPHNVTRKDKYGHTYNAQICDECIEVCDSCCDAIDDTTTDRGPLVRYRDYVMDGKLINGHAECAADYLISLIVDDRDFQAVYASAEEIAALIERAKVTA